MKYKYDTEKYRRDVNGSLTSLFLCLDLRRKIKMKIQKKDRLNLLKGNDRYIILERSYIL